MGDWLGKALVWMAMALEPSGRGLGSRVVLWCCGGQGGGAECLISAYWLQSFNRSNGDLTLPGIPSVLFFRRRSTFEARIARVWVPHSPKPAASPHPAALGDPVRAAELVAPGVGLAKMAYWAAAAPEEACTV